MNDRFYIAMVCYALLALLAAMTLEGRFRLAVWILLGALAFKTWLAKRRGEEPPDWDD